MTAQDTATRDTGITVRPATPAEWDAAGESVVTAYTADGMGKPDYLAVLRDARDRARDAEIVVAVDAAGQVLGCVTFAAPGSRWAELSRDGEAEFRMLGVRPDARGRGVGAALVEWCLDRAIEHGHRRVVISSEVSMHAAHRLYTRRGFDRRPDLDWSPAPGVQLIGFSLDLPGAEGGPGSAPGRRPPG